MHLRSMRIGSSRHFSPLNNMSLGSSYNKKLLWLPAALTFLGTVLTVVWWASFCSYVRSALRMVRWVLRRGRKPTADKGPALGAADGSGALFMNLKHGRVRYTVAGDPSTQPVILFLHGVTSFTCMWSEHMEALRQGTGHCVVGFDFYGHGFSECPKEIGYDNNDLAEQVLELLDALGIQRPVVLVGHSMGGLVAMTFAAHHPKRVAKLVLLNSIGLPPPASLHLPTLICVAFRGVYAGMRLPGVRHVAARLGSMAMASLADAGDVTHEQVLQVFRQQQRTDFGPGGQLVRGASMLMLMWAWQQRLSTRDVVFSAFLRRWNPFGDFEHTVRQTAAHQHPILILWGDKDILAPVTSVPRFSAIFPHALIRTHMASDHNLPLQRPAFVINEMAHFLCTTQAPAAK